MLPRSPPNSKALFVLGKGITTQSVATDRPLWLQNVGGPRFYPGQGPPANSSMELPMMGAMAPGLQGFQQNQQPRMPSMQRFHSQQLPPPQQPQPMQRQLSGMAPTGTHAACTCTSRATIQVTVHKLQCTSYSAQVTCTQITCSQTTCRAQVICTQVTCTYAQVVHVCTTCGLCTCAFVYTWFVYMCICILVGALDGVLCDAWTIWPV